MKEIQGFEIIGPKRQGLLNQSSTVGWKWLNEIGLFGEAVQLSPPENEERVIAEFVRFGSKWHRRFTAKVRHLWFYVWRQKGKIATLEQRIGWLEENWKPIPIRLGVMQRIAWRIVYGETYEDPWIPPSESRYD